jgi:hypothetical protein
MLSRRVTAIYKFFFMSYAPLPDVFSKVGYSFSHLRNHRDARNSEPQKTK